MMTPHQRPAGVAPATLVSRTYPGVEALESRIAPAALVTPATFTYTDGDGDVVKIQVTGKAGTVEFLDAVGGDVSVTGGDIAKIVITKPSADFAISIADTNAAVGLGLGDNIVDLGLISGPAGARLPIIKGIFTAASSPGVNYQLQGFSGTDFSVGGGLNLVGAVVGDGLGATADIDLKSLGKGTSVHLGSVDDGATVRIDGKLVGNFKVGALDGDLTAGSVLGLLQIGHIGGTATLTGDLAGRLILGDPDPLALAVTEELTIQGSVLSAANLNTTSDLLLHVTKDVLGNILTGGSLQADIGGVLKGASLLVGDDLTLDVTGEVIGSAIVAQHSVITGSVFKKGMTNSSIVGGTGLNLDITGSVKSSRFSGGTANLSVSISGRLVGSQFLSGGDATVTIGFSVEKSNITPDGRLTLDIGTPPQGAAPGVGDVTASSIGSKSTSAVVNIGGKVIGSQFTTGTDLDLTVGGSLVASAAQSGNDLTLSVGTNVLGSRFAIGSDANVTIGGQLAASTLMISNNLTATIGQAGLPIVTGQKINSGIAKTRIETSDGSSDLTVVGPVAGTVIESGQNATLHVDDLTGLDPKTNKLKLLKVGTVAKDVQIVASSDASVTVAGTGSVSAKILAGNDALVDVAALFAGSINAANDVSLTAGSVALAKAGGTSVSKTGGLGYSGSVTALAKGGLRAGGDLTFLVAGKVSAPLIDVAGNVKDFSVGGSFSGGLIVGGNFIAGGTAAAATVVGGVVSKSSFLHIGGDFGGADAAPAFIFDKGFDGTIEIGGDVLTDLTFNGSVNRLAVDGRIGGIPAGGIGDAVADIVVKGKINSFTSASLFARTSATGGNFVDAAGTILGALRTDLGAPLVGPLLS